MVAVKRKPPVAKLVAPEREGRQAWTFSSSGWLFVYFFGVIKCLKQMKLNKGIYVVGSSGGACAGTYLFLDAKIDETVEYVKKCAVRARSSPRNALRISEYVAGAIEQFTPPGAGPALSGNVEISITTLPWFRNVRLKQFENNEEVRDAVLASARIAGLPMHMPGYGWAMDGAFSDFQIIKAIFAGGNFLTMHSEDAITVCPFYMSRADIKPSKWIPPWWAAYPPPPEQLQDLFELGYKDTMTWLRDNGKLAPGDAKGQNGDAAQAAPATAQEGFLKAKHGHSFSHRVAQAAMEAPSCDESLKEAVAGAWGILRRLLGYIVWFLICWELFMWSCLSFGSLTVTFLTSVTDGGDSFHTARKRFANLCKSSTISSWELLKSILKYSPQHIKVKDRQIGRNLQEHSLIYRTFFFMLQ